VRAGGASLLMTAVLLSSHKDEDSKKVTAKHTGDGKVILVFFCWLEGSKLFQWQAMVNVV
jgi:hypothetical protein